jgi:hypothetical protein
MNKRIIVSRGLICGGCKTPCEIQRDAAAHADPCRACHLGKWGRWECPPGATADTPARGGDTAPAVAPTGGLGDAVAMVAAPIGHALGLDPARCGCNQRQANLNAAVPFRPDADPGVVL